MAATAAKGVSSLVKGTATLPIKHPLVFTLIAVGVATTSVMATSGLAAGPAFGAVAGKVGSGTVAAVKSTVPFAWDAAVANAPEVGSSILGWGKGVWASGTGAAAANEHVCAVLAAA